MAAKKKYQKDEELAGNLADALKELPDNWIMCRDMRHAWEVDADFNVVPSKAKNVTEVRRTLNCLRCETKRVEKYHLAKWGLEKYSQHYEYPDHYQIHGVPRGVKPSFIVQGEQYRRSMTRVAALANGKGTKLAVAN